MLLGKEKNVNYFYECITRLVNYQERIQLSHWLSQRFYSGNCTELEKQELLKVAKKCIENLQQDDLYIIIKEPFFTEGIVKAIQENKEYYICKNVSYWKFKRYSPSATKKEREPLIIP